MWTFTSMDFVEVWITYMKEDCEMCCWKSGCWLKDGGIRRSQETVQQSVREKKKVYFEAVLEDGLAIGALDSFFFSTAWGWILEEGFEGLWRMCSSWAIPQQRHSRHSFIGKLCHWSDLMQQMMFLGATANKSCENWAGIENKEIILQQSCTSRVKSDVLPTHCKTKRQVHRKRVGILCKNLPRKEVFEMQAG